MKEPMEMIKFFAVNMKIGKRLKRCAMIDLDNDAIYTQRDLDEEREAVIDEVLEIIDRLDAEAVEDFELDTDYGLAVVHDRFAKARKKIEALKGGE